MGMFNREPEHTVFTTSEVGSLISLVANLNPEPYNEAGRAIIYKCKAAVDVNPWGDGRFPYKVVRSQ